jgi:hypothetical protein
MARSGTWTTGSDPCPAGAAGFVCEWPGRGIPASRLEVNGAAIREAANAAVTLWHHDPYCAPTTPYVIRQTERPMIDGGGWAEFTDHWWGC